MSHVMYYTHTGDRENVIILDIYPGSWREGLDYVDEDILSGVDKVFKDKKLSFSNWWDININNESNNEWKPRGYKT